MQLFFLCDRLHFTSRIRGSLLRTVSCTNSVDAKPLNPRSASPVTSQVQQHTNFQSLKQKTRPQQHINMKRSAPSSTTSTDRSDTMSSWQACQARFRKSRKTSLLEDVLIDQSVIEHMQLAPPASQPVDKDVFEFLPMRRDSMDDSSASSYDDLTPASASALPLVPLRRDHSSGGGRRLPLHHKRQTLNTLPEV